MKDGRKQEEGHCGSHPLHNYRSRSFARNIGAAIMWIALSVFGLEIDL